MHVYDYAYVIKLKLTFPRRISFLILLGSFIYNSGVLLPMIGLKYSLWFNLIMCVSKEQYFQ